MRAVHFLTAATIAAVSWASAQPVPVPVDDDDDIDDIDDIDDRWEERHESSGRDGRYERRASHRDRYARWEASRYAREYRGRWFPLMRFSEADTGRQPIDVDGTGGRLEMLRVEADRGRPVIRRIAIEYMSGRREVIRIDAPLSRGQGQVIDLRGEHRLRRIVVVTDPRSDGLYSIYGT